MRLFKITDRKGPPPPPPSSSSSQRELTEDERFFADNDMDATAAFVEHLERERAYLEHKEKMGQQTQEWREYEEEVEAVIEEIEHRWLVSAEPITKETTKQARAEMEQAVRQVQEKHQKLNDKRIEAYDAYRRKKIAAGDEKTDEAGKMPVSQEYARLLDKFK